jgi:hypothetical protein
MEDNVQKAIWIGISLMLTGVILSMIVGGVYLSQKYNEAQLKQQSISEQLAEHRNNMFYNNTHVYRQDVVDYIMKWRGERNVIVRFKDETDSWVEHEWSADVQSSNYKNSEINALVPMSLDLKDNVTNDPTPDGKPDTYLIYDSVLTYGPNGDVTGVNFIACPTCYDPADSCTF